MGTSPSPFLGVMRNFLPPLSLLYLISYKVIAYRKLSVLLKTLRKIRRKHVFYDISGVLLCISYEFGIQLGPSPFSSIDKFSTLPTVLLPQWPLPLQVLGSPLSSSGSTSTLALISHPLPYNFRATQPPTHSDSSREEKSHSYSYSHSSHLHPHPQNQPSWDTLAEFVPLEPQAHGVGLKQRVLVS